MEKQAKRNKFLVICETPTGSEYPYSDYAKLINAKKVADELAIWRTSGFYASVYNDKGKEVYNA